MKETFDGIFETLNWMKRYAIHNNPAALYSYSLIEKKVKKLQDKYNESLQKEPMAAKNTEMTALEIPFEGGMKMDAVKFLKEKKRMCNSYWNFCTKCEIHNQGNELECEKFMKMFPEQTVDIVEKWSKEHPQETRLTQFLKHYPNAQMSCRGIPQACVRTFGFNVDGGCISTNCIKCWNTPLDEVN